MSQQGITAGRVPRRASAEAPAAAAPPKKVVDARTVRAANKRQAALDAQLLNTAEAELKEREAQRTAEARASRSTGRTSRAAPRVLLDDDGLPLTRKTRGRNVNTFDIPASIKKPGFDYEWKVLRYNGQAAEAHEIVEWREAGWRPVKAKDAKVLCPPDWKQEHVERGGQVLVCRPMAFSEEARAEQIKDAEDQKYDKLKGALAGPAELGKVTRRQTDKFEIEGVVGNLNR